MLETRIQQQFFESADGLYQAADRLAKPLAAAAQAVVSTVTAGARLWCAGVGVAQADAQVVAALLCHRFESERPGLAAVCLEPQLGALQGPDAIARQLLTLAHPGDLLIWLDPLGDPASRRVIPAAREQEVNVVALTGVNEQALQGLLTETDVWVPLGALRLPRLLEAQRVALHALCDAVDAQLLGLE